MVRPFPIHQDTIEAAVSTRVPAVELVQKCLQAVDTRESDVRAWVVLDRDDAMRQAHAADARMATGAAPGPLQGVPFGIKDIIDVAGLPTSAGSKRGMIACAERDAPVVASLRAAGAIILGKTVTTPYAWIDPPSTTNPWNPAHTPGGSSSGSAAALAAGMCLGALGSQTGGSLTRPASFCGVASLKPTVGRLSTEGVLPLAKSLDHPGPLAKTARDLATIWRSLTSGDQVLVPLDRPPRLGRLRDVFDRYADLEAREAMTVFTKQIRKAGARVNTLQLPPSLTGIHEWHRIIMAAEAAAAHLLRRGHFPDDYPPRITELLVVGEETPATLYIRAIEHQARAKREFNACFAGFDALITPAARGAAPDLSTTGDPVMNSPWSYLGLPTVSIPVALSEAGLPLGLQLIGPPNGESALLAAAIWCEEALACAS